LEKHKRGKEEEEVGREVVVR